MEANDITLISDSPLNHWGTFNRPELHTGAAPSTSATDNVASRRRKPDDTKSKPYIKKPLNAFMLFKAEQRQNVADELHITDSAQISVVLGRRWQMMSEKEQAPYFHQAHREKMAHEAKYPGWSTKDNYWKMMSEQKQAPYFDQAHREKRAHEAKYLGWSTKENYWKMMSEQKQAPYFDQAHREKRAHEAKYPGWSSKENYANDITLISDSPLNHWGTFNRPELHTGAAPSTSATNKAASRKLDDTKGKPYIKKPLNAFMLFKAEQRQNVAHELKITNSAQINVVLGQTWKMMSEKEKAPYFHQAHREKKAHEAKYPGWSYKDSYWKMMSEKEKAPYFDQAHREKRAHEAKYPGWSSKENYANNITLISDSPLNHRGTFNRQELHTGEAPSTSATDNVASRKPDDTKGKPYIKKPLNAFMLFKAEQRQNVADELHTTDSAQINVVLGQTWKMMSEKEKAPYFDQAHREKKAHKAKYPEWSSKDNYGKKPKRTRAVKIPVPLNHHHHHVASPVAPANQRPGMMWNATAPMSFSNQTQNNQTHSYHTSHSQNNQKTTIILNGIPVQATPIDAFLVDCSQSSHLERRRSC